MDLEEPDPDITQPLVMCKSKYDWLYKGVLPEGECGYCSYNEDNSGCRDYNPIEILDFRRIDFICEADRYDGH
tara:strand:+ start:119 stop:337 length:219 start_codon:yes stop_codon:yes gene_type:complete